MRKTYYKASNSTLDSVVTLPSFEVNVLKGDNKKWWLRQQTKPNNIGEVEIWSWKKIYDHSQPFRWFKKGSCLSKDTKGTKYW